MSSNLFELFAGRFPKDPAQAMIETPEGIRYSYAEADQWSARFANFFRERGLEAGDRVAAQVSKSPQALFLYLACLRAELIYLPLNTGYTRAEMAYFLGDAEPRVVVCDPASQGELDSLISETGMAASTVTLDAAGQGSLFTQAQELSSSFAPMPSAPNATAAILYTSGTTGRPKGVMLSHDNLASNALVLHQVWGWQPGDVLLHALPIFHVHGLFVACHCALLNGSTMLFLPKFDPGEVMRLLPRATVMMGVPTFYTRLLSAPEFGQQHCASMRLFVSGSAPLLEETFHEFQTRTGHTILERYGMSETGMNTSNPLNGERIAGTVGPPLPGVGVRVTNDAGQALNPGEVGNVEVKGPNVFGGYWRMPEKTAEDFTADGYLKTGDLGTFDNKGYLSIVGRAKDMVITGGYNVYPKEIELVLDELAGVKESAVFGVNDADFGEAVTAVVVPNGQTQLDEVALITSAREQLAAYKVPKAIHVVEELPRNTMGKVQKNLLREQYG